MTIHVERYEIDPDHQEMLSTVLVAIEQDIVEKTGHLRCSLVCLLLK